MITTRVRRRLPASLLLAILLLGLAPSVRAQQHDRSAAGVYAGEILGVRFELLLKPDGTALAAGQSGHWSQHGQNVTLVDAAGAAEHGILAGSRLTMKVQGVDIVLERSRAVAPARALTVAGHADAAPAAVRGAPPDAALARRLLGCWERFQGNSSYMGNGSSGATLRLFGDGTYSWMTFAAVSVPGAGGGLSRDTEQGHFQAVGDRLITSARTGATGSRPIALARGFLFIGGTRYIPCGN